MNNSRYESLVRPAAVAGLISAAVVTLNAAKMFGTFPTTAVVQLVAPVAQLAAIVFMIGIGVWRGRAERLQTLAVGANVLALAALVGVEFVLNLVFAWVDPAVVTELRAGPVGTALVIVSVSYLIATVLFAVGFWNRLPKPWLAVYVGGAVLVSLRAFVPEIVLNSALLAMAIGIVGLALTMLRRPAVPRLQPA